jgi:hypothetical protein
VLLPRRLTADTDRPLGDGRIDNLIVDSAVHVAVGVLVLATLAIAVVLVTRHALRDEPIERPARISLTATTAALGAQVLLGIKLLDQGQGIVQLYIHYVGGLIPLGSLLAAGWFARGDSGRSSRFLAALLAVAVVSASMAFFIGRAYANQ